MTVKTYQETCEICGDFQCEYDCRCDTCQTDLDVRADLEQGWLNDIYNGR